MNQANTAQVVQFHTVGGHLQLDEVPLPVPAKGEVRLRVKAIGINRVGNFSGRESISFYQRCRRR